jgi:Pvc16 N-terminal domain
MSNALAIAATTAVMRQMLQRRFDTANLAAVLGQVTVSALPPDRIVTGTQETSTLNVFLYQVTPNPGWRNVELASRDASGARLTRQPLALDLHYMLSAYGQQDLHAEIILGFGLQVLHEFPVLTRELIQQVFSGNLSNLMALLATSGLAQQEELIKITPQLLTTEELSKLWTGFQDRYRPTAAFLATVVLIRTDEAVPSGPPVRKPLVVVQPLLKPTITSVEPQMVPTGAHMQVALRGEQLLAPGAQVVINGPPGVDPDVGSTPTQVSVTLPADTAAGLATVRIVQPVVLGEPGLPHNGVESNIALLMVQPAIRNKAGTSDPDVTFSAGAATVVVDPPVGRKQQAVLLLNQIGPPPRLSFSLAANSRDQDPNPTTNTLVFARAGVPSADYLMRVQVDGAESPLAVDANGTYAGPRVHMP